MCGRYAIAYDSNEIAAQFRTYNLDVHPQLAEGEHHERSYNVAPTTNGAVYRAKDHELRYMKWGLVPHWTKDASQFKTYRTFNARLENLQESKMWIQCCNAKRCSIPISGYYEWRIEGQSKKKHPYYVTRKDSRLIFLAGMYDYIEKDDLWTYTIITGPAPTELEWLHNRMPVILEPASKAWNAWMDPHKDKWSQDELNSLLTAHYNDEDMLVYRVSPDVGKVTIDEEYLVKPIFKKDTTIAETQEDITTGSISSKKRSKRKDFERELNNSTNSNGNKNPVKDEVVEDLEVNKARKGKRKRDVVKMLSNKKQYK